MVNIKHQVKLLQQLAAGLSKIDKRITLGNIEVVIIDGDNEYTFSLVYALDFISNDIFYDERGDWSNADKAIVRTF